MNPGQLGTPSHYGRTDDVGGECFEWDLLWVGPDDAGIIERQLSLCKKQVNHDYAYGTVLCSFFFEKI